VQILLSTDTIQKAEFMGKGCQMCLLSFWMVV